MDRDNEIKVKMSDEVLRGVYANEMMVTHTKEEFLLDFMNVFPPEGIVNARIIVSPGHAKRIIAALQENIAQYEADHGTIDEPLAAPIELGSLTIN